MLKINLSYRLPDTLLRRVIRNKTPASIYTRRWPMICPEFTESSYSFELSPRKATTIVHQGESGNPAFLGFDLDTNRFFLNR